MNVNRLVLLSALLAATLAEAGEPVQILKLDWTETDPAQIDYVKLPLIPGQHAVVNPVTPGPDAAKTDRLAMHHLRLNLHNYLVHLE